MKYLAILLSTIFLTTLSTEEQKPNLYNINFPNVEMKELVSFLRKTVGLNIVANDNLLNFTVNFVTCDNITKEELINIFSSLLNQYDLSLEKEGNHYIINKLSLQKEKTDCTVNDGKFVLYKLKYHLGEEILQAIKHISGDIISTKSGNIEMVTSIDSMQWIKSTNSLFFSGRENATNKISNLIDKLDVPLKQVLIEVLVIETNISNSLDFGLKWSANQKYQENKLLTSNNFVDSKIGGSDFDKYSGFSMEIIGDIILHKQLPYNSMNALITAIQQDSKCSIILSQKIVTQENKLSKIFVGDNIPFTNSIVNKENVSTKVLEYKDVGVSLNILPLLGEKGTVSLDISEEITEAVDKIFHTREGMDNAIRTSKTNMKTNVHVPNGHFLILSGMTKNTNIKDRAGPPILGSIPIIGAFFKNHKGNKHKKNMLIFVKPQIINSELDYLNISKELKDAEPQDLQEENISK